MANNNSIQKPSSYSFAIEEEHLSLISISSSGEKSTLSIPFTELLQWTHQLNQQISAIGLKPISAKSSYMEDEKKKHKQAYARWTEEADQQLRQLAQQPDFSLQQAAKIFQRNAGAITSRLNKLGLGLDTGSPIEDPDNSALSDEE